MEALYYRFCNLSTEMLIVKKVTENQELLFQSKTLEAVVAVTSLPDTQNLVMLWHWQNLEVMLKALFSLTGFLFVRIYTIWLRWTTDMA